MMTREEKYADRQEQSALQHVVIAGKHYHRVLAQVVEDPEIRDNDHGGILVFIGVQLEGGARHDYAPSFSRKFREDLAAAMHLFWTVRHLQRGWIGYALIHEHLVCGFEDPFRGVTVVTEIEVAYAEALPEDVR